jgi:glycosyltransferase involved in cell wall biosynthesis
LSRSLKAAAVEHDVAAALNRPGDPTPDVPPVDVTVIIPCYNGAATLQETLDGLTAQVWERPWEIVLSDNGSTDASVAIFRETAARRPDLRMRVVDASARKGRSYAVNVGVVGAAGRAVVFCDADDVPAPGWLAALGAALDAHELVAARVDSTTLNADWVAAYKAWPGPGVYQLGLAPYCLSAGGGIMGFRKSLVRRIGLFDERFVTAEDNDFCIRAHFAGATVADVPDATIRIRFRADLGALYRQSRAWSRYNVLLYKKYRADGPPLVGRWTAFLSGWARLGRWVLAKKLLRRPESMADRARFAKTLGWEVGRLEGMLRYRVGPNAGRPPAGTPDLVAPLLAAQGEGGQGRAASAAAQAAIQSGSGGSQSGAPRAASSAAGGTIPPGPTVATR